MQTEFERKKRKMTRGWADKDDINEKYGNYAEKWK